MSERNKISDLAGLAIVYVVVCVTCFMTGFMTGFIIGVLRRG